MKAIALVLLASLAGCARTPNPANDVAEVKRLELRLWEDWRTHDVDEWSQLTAKDYSWSDGKDMRDYASVRRELDIARLERYRLTPMQVFAVAPDSIALSYRAEFSGSYEGKHTAESVSELSLWAKRDGRWQNVLLQEVPTGSGETDVKPPEKA